MRKYKEFIENISEAFTFFPKDEESIVKTLTSKGYEDEVLEDILNLYKYLSHQQYTDTPINLDIDVKNKRNFVNISRTLKGLYDIEQIKNAVDLKRVKIKFGNGSSGNRGVNNQGNAFEQSYAQALMGWYTGEVIPTGSVLDSILDLDKTYGLSSSEKFKVSVEAAANTKRPLEIKGNNIIVSNSKGSGFDIGSAVTDITVETDKKPVYLSLKTSTTTTFFNVGVRTILTPKEIKEGNIKNTKGLSLLNLFGIDPDRFCTIFNDEVKTESGVEKVKAKPELQNLLQSGIGYGYHVIHKVKNNILSYEMSREKMVQSSRVVGGVTIYYGGKKGKGKRVDVEMNSKYYKFGLNIRDTQGKDGYPTRMMCDFKTIK
tara:strand:+ start:21757 stop:22875 length:1119 start_codon:yes stop_codon:yes gene_type:complete